MTKHSLADFAVLTLRRSRFRGSGRTLRIIGEDLQWVALVEKVSHVDQVNIEVGIVFVPSPPKKRIDCRVLWSLDGFGGDQADEVARALVAVTDYTIEEREAIVGDAIMRMAAFVHDHPDIASVKQAYRQGQLAKAFLFADAKELLESP